ncbi:MAG: coagulation factor 5/8 type domain-containing protein, partial [Burkholderiales bacterium]|nr:coagulation factor 5/8 type domain-containing protein [Burkholderiales bacterium]
MKALLLTFLLASPLAGAAVIDDMKDATVWKATASDQVKASLRRDARDDSLCLDYDFAGVSGYAVLRRELPQDWPADFALTVQIKGTGSANDVQIKFVDASGDNVWWVNRPALALPGTLTDMNFKRRHVAFAWGPVEDRVLKRSQFIEFVVVAGQQGGGPGNLCVGALGLEPREPAPKAWPEPKRTRGAAEFTLDFQTLREFNGLWFASGTPTRVEVSDDNRRWKLLSARPGRALFVGEQEWRWLRVRYDGKKPPEVELRDATQWPDRNAAVAEVARSLPRGDLPRAFISEQNYWTVVGVDGGAQRSGLVSEDGAIELTRGGPSIEPAILLPDGRLVTWAQVRAEHHLVEHALPVVQWRHADVELRVEAGADGPAKTPELLARYTLRNPTPKPQHYALLLALRPWQVNPPQQFLSTQGGISPLPSVHWADGAITSPGLRVTPREKPTEVRAAPWSAGPGLAVLLQAPALTHLVDIETLPSALMRFDVDLAPGESRSLGWVTGNGDAASLDTRLAVAAAQWRDRLGVLQLDLPPQAQPVVDTMRSALAQILMSRDGPALRPGTRAYARSWVRDGAMMVAGLVRMGEAQAAEAFVDWFGGYIFESGKVPCCVDQRGADPVVENDSHGQYLFALAELWRHSNQGPQDRALLSRHWPKVQRVMAWMEA